MDESATRLLYVFLDELEERAGALNRDLLKLESDPPDRERGELIIGALREAHSLKGAAASVGAVEIEENSHRLESMLVDMRDSASTPDAHRMGALFQNVDALRDGGRRLRAGVPDQSTTPSTRALQRRDGTVRVSVEKLDRLLEQSGELLVAHHRAEERQAEIRAIGEIAVAAGARNPREIEHALERLSKAIASDNATIERAARRVSAEVRNIRMLPFALAVDGLDRIVRDASLAFGKKVRLNVQGRDIELDRAVLDGLRDPLVHLVRNAMDHGIESPARRIAAGKPVEGTIDVTAALRGGGVEVTVADDGAGLDLHAIRQQAAERGFSIAGDEALDAVFLPGLSTARTITNLSGRGVGLDAVRSAIDALRGTTSVTSKPGNGTAFALMLPLTLATLRAIFFDVSGQIFALDSGLVERVARVDPKSVTSVEGRPVITTPDEALPLVPFSAVLGYSETGPHDNTSMFPVMILKTGNRRTAVRVDALLDEREILVRILGPRLAEAPAVAGATILPDGYLALILRRAFVLERSVHLAGTLRRETPKVSTVPQLKRILLVDDSITTRTLERSILEAAGYEVIASPDGEDAWSTLNATDFDLVVSDVDMPRMDGFALVERIRASNRLRDTPVVLVTGRESDEDKRRGIEVGADAYVVKSGFDQRALIDTIADLL